MAEKLTIQSNVRYLIRFLRDDCTPYTGQYGASYSFYVTAHYRNPETEEEIEKQACTLYLQDKEAHVLSQIGAGKGAVVSLLRKEVVSEGGKRTYQWSLTQQTAPEKPGFEIVEFGTKARVGRLGAPVPEPPPSGEQEEKTLFTQEEKTRPPQSRGLEYHQRLYAHCLAASMGLWQEAVEDVNLIAVGATASTLYIQLLREGPPPLALLEAPIPTVAADPSDLPF